MNRRKSIKTLAIGAVIPTVFFRGSDLAASTRHQKPLKPNNITTVFQSQWHQWPDMVWVGPEYWGNRLQDWQVKEGKATCAVCAPNRTLHCLTTQLSDQKVSFETSVIVELLNHKVPASSENYVGFRLGAKGIFPDYRSAAVYGKGLEAGITAQGQLFIGDNMHEETFNIADKIRLHLHAIPDQNGFQVKLIASTPSSDLPKATFSVNSIPAEALVGNIALVAHVADSEQTDSPSAAFSDWTIQGDKLHQNEELSFGPICFAQYTLHQNTLKLNAQLSPVEAVPGHKVEFQIRQNDLWNTLQESSVDPLGRVVQFRIENWEHQTEVPYRIRLYLPLSAGNQEYFYEGTIAEEPTNVEKIITAVFSCNADYGFPDSEVAPHVLKHQPHLAVFLGDQFYESTGGFGIDTSSLEKASLDYLRKWYMFGWAYRDIFRHIPSAFIPDDHDVYHGNLWGESGKLAPTDQGWGYEAQDQGGYKMPVEWVNMVQRTQTSHLPDPYDPTPVKRGIGVYYTNWNYGGISFAILEDRKFKSAPKNVLPEDAKVLNGFIQNPDFNIKAHYDVEAELLGERQMKFLNDWASNWDQSIEMKAVLSQTNFCTVATLPKGEIIDSIVPRLPIPKSGEYVEGDAPTTDMDSNGWPQKGRDDALKAIRKCFAIHIAGDQHLASVVHYGVDEFEDAGFAFGGPALNNLFPRRWWPTVEASHQPLPGKPKNTGNFLDGFGNHMTVHAVANPHQTGKMPARIYDRATGYGIVTFDKATREINISCWPRYVDPEDPSTGEQYEGWPITIAQQDNYGRKEAGYLAILEIIGADNPVVQLIDEEHGEIVYSLRIKGNTFQPKVFHEGTYTVMVSDTDQKKTKKLQGLQIDTNNKITVFI